MHFIFGASLLNTLFFCAFGRLMEENDPEIQVKVLECLLTWKDDYLVPYDQHLRNLISSKNLREELTTWSLSREAGAIEECHRMHLVPLVIRLLMPKVRMLKELASRKVNLLGRDMIWLLKLAPNKVFVIIWIGCAFHWASSKLIIQYTYILTEYKHISSEGYSTIHC